MPRQTLTFLTPCFCGGAENKTGPAELRVPSLRGQLRYWVRVLFYDTTTSTAAAQKEHQIFGGIRAQALGFIHPAPGQRAPDALASRFTVRLNFRPTSPVQTSQPLCPHDPYSGQRQLGKGWQWAIPAGTQFDLEWGTATSAGGGLDADFLRVLKAWVLLGSLGLRANRASGSVWRHNPEGSAADFLRDVSRLSLPSHLVVKVLRPLTSIEIAAWVLPIRDRAQPWQQLQGNSAELLRAVATDTLAFGRRHDGALGYGGPNGRKASPLKFKLCHFKEGHRLIAISDRRDARHGQLADAITELVTAKKPIGYLLRDATII